MVVFIGARPRQKVVRHWHLFMKYYLFISVPTWSMYATEEGIEMVATYY